MAVYRDEGDDWLRPQHYDHVRLFYLQHKELIASKIIMEGGAEGLEASLARLRELRAKGSDVYLEEGPINGIGYHLMNEGNLPEAIEVLELNPDNSNAVHMLEEIENSRD